MKRIASVIMALSMIVSIVPAFAADTVEYKLRNVNDGGYAEVSMDVYQTYETEHFQIFYDTDGANSSKVTASFLQKCETVLENCWDLYVEKMGMEPTSTSVNSNGDKVTQYKTNVILMGTGVTHYDLGANDWGAYGSVDSCGYPYFMCCLAAMNSPSVVAHEYGHAVHYAQGDNAWKDNIYLGPWFEAVANWFAEQYIYEYMPGTTQLSNLYLRATNLTKMNGRGYYEAWPILQYLTEDPDNTGVYGEKFVQKLLSTNLGSTNVLFWEVLEKANANITTADTVGMYASHMATMDFKNKALYNKYINSAFGSRYFFWQQRYTILDKLDSEENTYTVPIERAPQAMGYNIIPLDFTPGEVSVTLNGLTNTVGADWRARLVKESSAGNTSYSDLFSSGETMTITVENTDTLYLSVAATPDISTMSRHTITGWAEHSKESNYPFEKKTQYPYAVKLENASPTQRPISGGLKQHPNGGGYVATTAKVASTAYVGPNAMVLGNATVSDNAIIDGYAVVCANAKVTDNAYVGDSAVLFDNAQVSGNARVIENACLYGNYKASGDAVIKGVSLCLSNGSATDEANLYGDWFGDLGENVSSGSFSGYHSISSDSSYAAEKNGVYVRNYIKNLRARYEFSGNLRDSVGYTDLYGINNPIVDDDKVYLDGNCYLVLDDSVLYYDDMTISLSAEGEGEVLSIGNDISLNISKGKTSLMVGKEEIVIDCADKHQEIYIAFDKENVTLTVNGDESTVKSTVTPLSATREGSNYIGRNFVGNIDFVRIFDSSAVEKNEIDARLYKVFDSEKGAEGWNTTSSNVNFSNGIHVTGAVSGTVTSPQYKANKFILEFTPSGGKAYPDHGILDIDCSVLFAHRYASDANSIHIGRGEINSNIRGANYITDTTNQSRLTNFVCEKLGESSGRTDRGTVVYDQNSRVRIIAENSKWTDAMSAKFATSENRTEKLSSMAEGDDIYVVTYMLIEDSLMSTVSQSIYKGHFGGFGGLKLAGGANGVTVSYGDLEIYTDNAEPTVTNDANYVTIGNFDGKAVALFAAYDGNRLSALHSQAIENDGVVEIPDGFEDSKFMIFESSEKIKPITKALEISAATAFVSSVGQNSASFHSIKKNDGKVTYTFYFKDNGSKDSGIIIGSSSGGLNTSSSNYFASGSIVILFADGNLYTRDNTEKKFCAKYTVGDKVKIKIDADVATDTYTLYVNDESVAQEVSFRNSADVLDTLALVENKGGNAFEVYNFRAK